MPSTPRGASSDRSPYVGPRDPELRAAWGRARRRAAREHHPDAGGSATDLVEALDAVDRAFVRLETSMATDPHGSRVLAVVSRVARTVGRAGRGIRASLPRGWPGRRRYFDL